MKAFLILNTFFFTAANEYTFKNEATSFLKYKQWNAEKFGTLSFKFKTHSPYGLLVYSDNHNEKSKTKSFIRLSLSYGKLNFIVQIGSEDYRSKKSVSLGKNLNDLRWHDVKITRNLYETAIDIDGTSEQILVTDGTHDTLSLDSGVFIGGISDELSQVLLDKSVLAIPSRYIGCIKDFKFKTGKQGKFSAPVEESTGVSRGCHNACHSFNCLHNGRCINYFNQAKCDCIGTGYHGSNCSKEAETVQFNGDEYWMVTVSGPLQKTTENEIVLRFKTREANGLLLATNSGNDHLMVEIQSTIVRISMDLGGGLRNLQVNEISFNDGVWHLIRITRTNRDISITVDNKYSTKSVTPGLHTILDLREYLFVGGHPDVKNLAAISSKSGQNFKGCLQQVYFNQLNIVYKVLNTKSSFFKSHGVVKEGCNVIKPKIIHTRESEGSDTSNSASGLPYLPRVTVKQEVQSTQPTFPETAVQVLKNEEKLSKRIIIWIIVGIIVGSIALIIVVFLIVHNFKKRYSSILLPSHQTKQLLHKTRKCTVQNTVIYTPNTGHALIKPHIV